MKNKTIREIEDFVAKYQKKKDKLQLKATYFSSGGEPLPLVAGGSFSKEAIEIDACSIGDFLSIEGTFPFQATDPMASSIKLSHFSLEQLHSLIPQTRPYFGQLQGHIEMSGTRDRPGVDLKLTLNIINGQTVVTSRRSCELNRGGRVERVRIVLS